MQVAIRVRIAEISRNVIKNLGVNWNVAASPGSFSFGLASGRDFLVNSAAGAGAGVLRAADSGSLSGSQGTVYGGLSNRRANITALVDALATEGLVSILAEPTLTPMSGEKASFLAGGEFPIPIVQGTNNNAISIDYRKYGISLDFTPTVLSDKVISLYVKPEVSELSTEGAVTLNNFQIPALTTRRTETTVQLGSGESLVIAGLIQNKFSTQIDKLPGAGDVPVLGPLFRSSRFQKNESELIIVVTPYIVRPAANNRAFPLPTEDVQPPTDLERILEGRLAHTPGQGKGSVRIKGDAGFIVK
jgi:pilus assembly protein CpaC